MSEETTQDPILTRPQLERQLRAMKSRRVAVIGDAILDEFLWGDATRISPEAPVPVVLLDRKTRSLGGAANVAANIVALGGRAVLYSAIGDDSAGQQLRDLADGAGIEIGFLEALPDRPTTVKHRIFARNKHILRFDQESTLPFAGTLTRRLLGTLRAAMSTTEAVVISDYAKGCITPGLVREVVRLCRAGGIPSCADPKQTSIYYRGVDVLKPNTLELEALSGLAAQDEDQVRRAAARTLQRQGCLNLLVTRGQYGMALFRADGGEHWLNSGGRAVADVTGAGDTVSAVLGLGLAAGLGVLQAARVADLAAAHVVGVPGTAVVRPDDLLAQLEQ